MLGRAYQIRDGYSPRADTYAAGRLRRYSVVDRETVRKGVRGNAPSMDLSGIRTIERAQRSLLASRRPTSRAYPRLFGRSQKRNSRKFAITSNAQATAKLRGFGDTPPSPASPLWG